MKQLKEALGTSVNMTIYRKLRQLSSLTSYSHQGKYYTLHELADFDSFLMPKNSIKGINAPLITNKLKDPTEWQTFDSYLVERGAADICFPVDFHFLKHVY